LELIHPSYEILDCPEREALLKKIEKIGRIAYKSEDKITEDSASRFVKMIMKNNHLSVIEHENISIKFITSRDVSHELVRHRLISVVQESQRYINYNKKGIQFIIPDWLMISPGEYTKNSSLTFMTECDKVWLKLLLGSEETYNKFINLKWKPEQARDILPNATKTELIVTANIREWLYIFTLRTASDAFSKMKQIMIPLLQELKIKLPEFFEEIKIGE
jgi:thymidylate synthase (FAD)